MLYNVVLVSAVQQRKTVIIIRISPPLRASLLPDPTPPHPLGCHRAPHQVEPPCGKEEHRSLLQSSFSALNNFYQESTHHLNQAVVFANKLALYSDPVALHFSVVLLCLVSF